MAIITTAIISGLRRYMTIAATMMRIAIIAISDSFRLFIEIHFALRSLKMDVYYVWHRSKLIAKDSI
ncbi:MAG: hypothetical protein ACRD4W_07525 [Nitrososphaeraceae archaeon]